VGAYANLAALQNMGRPIGGPVPYQPYPFQPFQGPRPVGPAPYQPVGPPQAPPPQFNNLMALRQMMPQSRMVM
jgi:hypothetical protein